MKKVGKRMIAWRDAKILLNPAFERAGIETCEIRYRGCTHWHQGYAHSLKRRNIPRGSALLFEVIKSCNFCHGIIEDLGEKRMSGIVRAIIANRVRPVEINL